MNILLQQDGRGWVADFKDLPGSPVVGIGRTPEQAVTNLFWITLRATLRDEWASAGIILRAAKNEGFSLVYEKTCTAESIVDGKIVPCGEPATHDYPDHNSHGPVVLCDEHEAEHLASCTMHGPAKPTYIHDKEGNCVGSYYETFDADPKLVKESLGIDIANGGASK